MTVGASVPGLNFRELLAALEGQYTALRAENLLLTQERKQECDSIKLAEDKFVDTPSTTEDSCISGRCNRTPEAALAVGPRALAATTCTKVLDQQHKLSLPWIPPRPGDDEDPATAPEEPEAPGASCSLRRARSASVQSAQSSDLILRQASMNSGSTAVIVLEDEPSDLELTKDGADLCTKKKGSKAASARDGADVRVSSSLCTEEDARNANSVFESRRTEKVDSIMSKTMSRHRSQFNQKFMEADGLNADDAKSKLIRKLKSHTEEWKDAAKLMRTRKCLRHFVLSSHFNIASCAIVVLHAIVIGVEVQYEATYLETTSILVTIGIIFNVWYCFELILRLSAKGVSFFTDDERRWNALDCGLTMISLSELVQLVLESVSGGDKGSKTLVGGRVLRLMRAIRLVRIIRVGRVLQNFRELYKMVFSIASAGYTFVWAVVALGVFTYIFAVCLTQATADEMTHADYAQKQVNEDLKISFGNLWAAWMTLFSAISGGQNWGELLLPLSELEWIYTALYLFYVTFTTFGVLNVVTSVFVDSAMQTSQHYRELAVLEEQAQIKVLQKQLENLFKEIDLDHNGQISVEELTSFLELDECSSYFSALGISTADARIFFKLMDQDNDGAVEKAEFFDCCTKLKGEAKSFDIHCIIFENKVMISKLGQFMEFVESFMVQSDNVNRRLHQHLAERLGFEGLVLEELAYDRPEDDGDDDFAAVLLSRGMSTRKSKFPCGTGSTGTGSKVTGSMMSSNFLRYASKPKSSNQL